MKNTNLVKIFAALTILFACALAAAAQISTRRDAKTPTSGGEVCEDWKNITYSMFSAEREIYYGCGYYEKGDFDLAAMRFRQAVGTNSKSATAYFYLGNAYMKLEKSKLAREAFDKAVELDSSYADRIAEITAEKKDRKPIKNSKIQITIAPSEKVADFGNTRREATGDALFYGDYVCTEDYYAGGTGNYSRRSEQRGILTLKSGETYIFRGEGGRYKYDSATGEITWTSGYLSADENTTKFQRGKTTAQIDITFKTSKGDLDWSCGTNLE